MGCSASKPGAHEPQCCCPCCGCCITLPANAVLYDEEHGPVNKQDDPSRTPSGQDDAHQTDRAISSLQHVPRGTVAPGVAIKEECNGLHDSHQGQDLAAAGHGCSSPDAGLLASDTDTAHSSVPLATATTTLPEVDPPPPSGPSGRWGMPSNLPPIPVLNFCMSMGMNARSLKTLRAHLKAKGFSMHPAAVAGAPPAQQQPTPQPSAQPTPPQAPSAHRWHSLQPMHSGPMPLATPAGDPMPTSPRHPPDLASTSWMGWHDASSQVGLPSPGGSGSDVASDDVWRDVIAEDSSEGEGSSTSSTRSYADGHRSEGHRSDSSEDSNSSATFKSAASLGPRSHRRHSGSTFPRPPQLDTTGASLASQPHSARKHTPGSRGLTPGSRGPGGSGGRNQSWEASVHIAQASIAADDLAHPQGGSTHPALDAFRAGRLSFAFSGGGFFFPYHLGCVIALKDMGIITDATPLAGASCGSIIIACVNSGLDLHKLVDRLLEFAEDCRTWGTAGRLRDVIVTFMTANLPPDAHTRCRGRTFISLTKVFPYLHPYIISDYTSKEDLVDAIATSCHIPAYCDGSFMARFRSHWFVDGGLVRHIPALPTEAGAAYVAGVSCVPFKFLESLPGVSRLQLLHSLAVSPDMFGAFPFGWHEVGGLVLAPAADPVLLQMVEMGKRDVTAWANAVGLIAHLASTRRVATPLTSPTEAGAARPSGDEKQRGRHKHRQRSSRVRTGTPMVSPLDNSSASVLSQPGGLPASVEDDWHDAVEDQTLISPSLPLPHTTSSNDTSSFVTGATVLSPAASQEGVPTAGHSGHALRVGGHGSMEVADEAMREGLAAAAGAVAGPLHMDAHQAIDALAGTSTLGMAQAAAVAAEGRDHAADRQLQVLRVTGGTFRPGSMAANAVTPASPNGTLLPVAAVMQPQLLQGQHMLRDDGMPVNGASGQRSALADSLENLPSALGVLQDASAVQAYCLDIDVDSSAWGGRGGSGTAAAAVAGSGETAAAGTAAAGPHTVQVTARIAGQPVVLELRLHMPADARAAS